MDECHAEETKSKPDANTEIKNRDLNWPYTVSTIVFFYASTLV